MKKVAIIIITIVVVVGGLSLYTVYLNYNREIPLSISQEAVWVQNNQLSTETSIALEGIIRHDKTIHRYLYSGDIHTGDDEVDYETTTWYILYKLDDDIYCGEISGRYSGQESYVYLDLSQKIYVIVPKLKIDNKYLRLSDDFYFSSMTSYSVEEMTALKETYVERYREERSKR